MDDPSQPSSQAGSSGSNQESTRRANERRRNRLPELREEVARTRNTSGALEHSVNALQVENEELHALIEKSNNPSAPSASNEPTKEKEQSKANRTYPFGA